MNPETFLLYFACWALVALTPGPAVICAMALATRHGLRPALLGILGIQLGHLVFFSCIALGLAALLASASTAFALLRFAGAAYLLFVGLRIINSTLRPHTAESVPMPLPGRGSLLLQGFGIQVTNPKALLFMSALLPQFLDPGSRLPLQLGILLATTIAVDTVVLAGYALFAMRSTRSLRDSRLKVWLERLFGTALVLFGLRLLATRK